MENLIKEVIELDKKARKEVELLEAEKSKIGEFILENRKALEKKYKAEAAKEIEETRMNLKKDLEMKKKEAVADFEASTKKLEESINKNKDRWIESIYAFCVEEN